MRTAKKIFAVSSFLVFLCTAGQCVRAQATPAPVLLTEENSSRAIAFDSVTHVRDPLSVIAANNLSQDRRARVALFGMNMALNAGEDATAVTVKARDARSKNYNLTIEFYGQVPALNWLTEVVVLLPDALAYAGDISISVTLHGQTSNEVIFNSKAQSEPQRVTIAHRSNIVDNYVDSCFSFEFGGNGQAYLDVTRNDWDLQFGNSPDKDEFNVSMVGDDCSRIKDLGPLNWTDNFQVPVLTAYAVPTIEPSVKAIVGHMYAVHTKDRTTDLYALFRVEALEPLTSVTITWKGVQSPE